MNIETITQQLSELRQDTENNHMEIASLMLQVRAGKMWAEADCKSFSDYCQVTRYHASTVYTWLQCYEIPELRQAYATLGAFVSKRLAQAVKRLDQETWCDLLDRCKTVSSSEAVRAIKATVAAATSQTTTTIDTTDKPMTLAQALKHQSALLTEKTELEYRVQEIDIELAELTKTIDELSK